MLKKRFAVLFVGTISWYALGSIVGLLTAASVHKQVCLPTLGRQDGVAYSLGKSKRPNEPFSRTRISRVSFSGQHAGPSDSKRNMRLILLGLR